MGKLTDKLLKKIGVSKDAAPDMSDEDIIAFLMKHSPESLGFGATDKRAKGGMMKKKGYAKGGTVSKNQPMTMDWFRKTIGTAEGRKLIGPGGGTGSSNSPQMILRKLMEKNTPTFKIDMSSKKKMIEKIKEMQGKKTAKAAKGGMMKKKGYAKGGAMKKKKGYAMGGMMEERKVNPTTGMAMKKGGMIDMRKSGMFSKGGLTKKRPRGK